jgi:hypothetical protein
VSNGAQANMKLGARDYLIQRNWVNAAGGFLRAVLLTRVLRSAR